jgi:hypothetical protein
VDISWDQQISNGGSFAFLFSHRVMKSIFSDTTRRKTINRRWFDLGIGYQIDIGWYTGITGIADIKIGQISDYSALMANTTVSNDVGNKIFKQNKSKRDTLNCSTKKSQKANKISRLTFRTDSCISTEYIKATDVYFFTKIKPRMTPHNSLILGQPNVESIYTLDDQDYNPFICDFEYGIVISRFLMKRDLVVPVRRTDVILSLNHRTPEIRNSQFKRWHHWGRISVSFPLF